MEVVREHDKGFSEKIAFICLTVFYLQLANISLVQVYEHSAGFGIVTRAKPAIAMQQLVHEAFLLGGTIEDAASGREQPDTRSKNEEETV